MKKILTTIVLSLTLGSVANAQSDYKMMAGVNGGIMGPACVNCGLLYGGGITFGYAVSQRIVPTIDVGSYVWNRKTEFGGIVNSYKSSALIVSLGGDFYIKEAYKGFFFSPEVSFIQYNEKYNDVQQFGLPIRNVTVGLNLGWAISLGDRIELVPHFGYSTWFENSKGRVTIGTKLGFKF